MPAELHRQLFDTISRQSSQLLADPCRSGERHLANDRGCDKASGYFRRVAKDNGQRTTGNSRIEESSSHFQGGQRHLFVGLDDAGTAGGKSGCDLAAWNEGWEVPWREGRNRPDRLLYNHASPRTWSWYHPAVGTPAFLSLPVNDIGRPGDFPLGFLQRFTLFQGHTLRDGFATLA